MNRHITNHDEAPPQPDPRRFVFLATAASASAALFSQVPVADAFVTAGSADPNAGSPTANYGAAGGDDDCRDERGEGRDAERDEVQPRGRENELRRSLRAGQWAVDGITLQLGANAGVQGAQPMNLIFNTINTGLFKVDWMANDSWAEGTGTPQLPTTDGVTFSTLGSFLSGADKTLGTFTYTPAGNNTVANYTLALDVTFTADVAAGGNVSLRGYAGDATVGYLANTRLFASGKPTLTVSASPVPEPCAGVLLAGAALLGLAWRRRDARAA